MRVTPTLANACARHDTVFVQMDSKLKGMAGMAIAHVLLLFRFTFDEVDYPCALVSWMVTYDEPDDDTGLWVVRPEFEGNGCRKLGMIHLDCVARAAHLLPVYGSSFVPENFHFSDALNAYRAYFVNHYIDNHTHQLVR